MISWPSVALGALFLTVPAVAAAQDVPRVQVAGGFAYLVSPDAILVQELADEAPGTSSTKGGIAKGPGWFGEIVGNVTPHAGVVGELSATYTTGTFNSRGWTGKNRAYIFLGGPRVTSRCCQGIVPFAQLLFGFVRSTADITGVGNPTVLVASATGNYYAYSMGGGADIRTSGSVGIHLGADLLHTSRNHSGGDSGLTWRVRAGLAFPMR